jgi:hypothetical protein
MGEGARGEQTRISRGGKEPVGGQSTGKRQIYCTVHEYPEHTVVQTVYELAVYPFKRNWTGFL